MLRNSIKQLMRTKVKSLLFFFLITLCAILICLGGNLLIQSRRNMEKFKKVFKTIATVEQTPTAYVKCATYDSGRKQYNYYTQKEYDGVYDLNKLKSLDVNFLSGPERRACYSTYLPDYKIYDEKERPTNEIIVEASPYEDGISNEPNKMHLKKVHYALYRLNVDFFYFCDHYNDKPEMMCKNKTYIMSIDNCGPHFFDGTGNIMEENFEYRPVQGPYSGQTTRDGKKLDNFLPNLAIEEVDDEFYAMGHDKYWDAYAKERYYMQHKVPVTATDDLNLMMPFYNGDINITEGYLLDEEDFEIGNQVCLIADHFAKINKIKAGDKITLPLRVADYGQPSIIDFNLSSLTAQGTNFEPFYTAEYTVKGIYCQLPSGGLDRGYALDYNEIIIPKKSIKNDDSENIGLYGDHLSPYNTAFRIENGTADKFIEKWNESGLEGLDFQFYDRGYSKLMDGIKQMEQMALLLFVIGAVMTILVLIFFCSMMIGGQKKRTAIERSLGLSKRDCVSSLLSGILLLTATGCLIGSLLGASFTRRVSNAMTGQEIFDRNYSAGIVASEIEEEKKLIRKKNDTNQKDGKGKQEDSKQEDIKQNSEDQGFDSDGLITALSFLSVFGLTIMISGFWICKNLKEEPLALLSGTEK